MHETNFTLGPIKKHFYLLLLYKLLQWHWGMGPSVKHVLGVQEWSYVVPGKHFFSSSKMQFGSGWPPPPPRFGESPDFFVFFFCETFPKNPPQIFWAFMHIASLLWREKNAIYLLETGFICSYQNPILENKTVFAFYNVFSQFSIHECLDSLLAGGPLEIFDGTW